MKVMLSFVTLFIIIGSDRSSTDSIKFDTMPKKESYLKTIQNINKRF